MNDVTLAQLLKRHLERIQLPMSRAAKQCGIPKQTLHNWVHGRVPRWHPGLSEDLRRLARALALDGEETERFFFAAGCPNWIERPASSLDRSRTLTVPKGWKVTGVHAESCRVGVDPERRWQDSAAVVLESRPSDAWTTCALGQTLLAKRFVGRRIRFSGVVAYEEVTGWSGLFLRIVGEGEPWLLDCDDMRDRALRGSAEWQRRSVVLDVPREASRITYGLRLVQAGRVWLAGARLELVDVDVPCTKRSSGVALPELPQNLDFVELESTNHSPVPQASECA